VPGHPGATQPLTRTGARDGAGAIGGPSRPTRYDGAMDAPVRPILVVDDDPKIAGLVRMYLEREGFTVLEAADGRSALASVALEDPALVVLDRMIPEVDGLSVLAAIRRHGRTPVIVISARGTSADRIEGLRIGADDYVPKPFSPAELVLRVRRVLERAGTAPADTAPPVPPPRPVLRHGGLVIDRDRHEVTVDGRPITLTATELRLLAALVEAEGRVLTRDQLMDAAYGPGEAVLDRTIDVHLGRLRDKLGDDADRPRFVATVRGVGYRAAPEPPADAEATGDQVTAAEVSGPGQAPDRSA
jgi:DNA-binding response OmpR family regulator